MNEWISRTGLKRVYAERDAAAGSTGTEKRRRRPGREEGRLITGKLKNDWGRKSKNLTWTGQDRTGPDWNGLEEKECGDDAG
jgi:hypothetical protein